MSFSDEILTDHRLSAAELAVAERAIARTLTWPELGVLSVLWSEHCSYKSTRQLLARLPGAGSDVLIGPGENAGVVVLDDDLCAVFKIESHNHPSFIAPFHGAATGVGGILRDIFTMGARPVAVLNSLRFGELDQPRTRYLLDQVVAGIAGYGNAFGVPTVGGEVFFHSTYGENCLVNAFAVGVARRDALVRGVASGVGNPVFVVGARTGRDGIHGATMASAGFEGDAELLRPNVQVGDPFVGKLLMEACLEAIASGAVIGLQDMGAAGLTSSSVEMAGRGNCGLLLHLDRVPLREAGMTPYEILLSESQERMTLVAARGREHLVAEIFERWGLVAAEIGEVTEDRLWRCQWHGEEVCALPVDLLVHGAPPVPAVAVSTPRRVAMTAYLRCDDPASDLLTLIGTPDHVSRRWIWDQFDHTIGTDTVVGPAGDAAVLRIKGRDLALALRMEGNARHVALDPRAGAIGLVAKACRHLACVGAEPIGASDGLNFGSPSDPVVLAQLEGVIEGLVEACLALDLPVVSGNVSLNNASRGTPIAPTPIVAVVGRIVGAVPRVRSYFTRPGLEVAVLGSPPSHGVAASSWAAWLHGVEEGPPPPVDLVFERRLHAILRAVARSGSAEVVRGVGDGGLALALAKACLGNPEGPVGLVGVSPGYGDIRDRLFGEDHGRAVVAYAPPHRKIIDKLIGDFPLVIVGITGGDRLLLDAVLDVPLERLRDRWDKEPEALQPVNRLGRQGDRS